MNTFDDCIDASSQEFLANPYNINEWMAGLTLQDRPIAPLGEDQHGASIEQLIATIMVGKDANVLRAVHQLRERIINSDSKWIRDTIEQRAEDIFDEQKYEPFFEPYADDAHHWY